MLRTTLTSIVCCAVLTVAAHGSSETLLLPAFAHNVEGADDALWSSELYLTNPGDQPVQVTLSEFLGGALERPAPCDLFMSPTRVVPPRSAVVWTASGLATDLGCAERALGALELNADGPVQVTSRMVRTSTDDHETIPQGVLSGRGQEFDAIPLADLPRAGTTLVLPALMWHRNACDGRAFETAVGFVNPGTEPARVVLDLERELVEGGVRLNGVEADFPYVLMIPPQSWTQVRIEPIDGTTTVCGDPESFTARLVVGSPVAIYATVVDRFSHDPRTVHPVALDDAHPAPASAD